MVAAAIPKSFGQTADLTEDIGSLKFYKKNWVENGDILFTELKTRPCKRSDFILNAAGDNKSQSLFYPTNRSAPEISKFWSEFKCIADVSDLKVNGNFDTSVANQLMIVFEKCDKKRSPQINCASETSIEQWMKFRYILTVENTKQFIQHEFEDDGIEKTSEIYWHALNYKDRTDYVKMIHRTSIELKDDYWGIKNTNHDGFFLQKGGTRSLPY